jgi:hypothetical protein
MSKIQTRSPDSVPFLAPACASFPSGAAASCIVLLVGISVQGLCLKARSAREDRQRGPKLNGNTIGVLTRGHARALLKNGSRYKTPWALCYVNVVVRSMAPVLHCCRRCQRDIRAVRLESGNYIARRMEHMPSKQSKHDTIVWPSSTTHPRHHNVGLVSPLGQ